MSGGHYDVVLADPADALTLKAQHYAGIVPILLKPTKADLNQVKAEFDVAFDASRDAIRLLPVIEKAAKKSH